MEKILVLFVVDNSMIVEQMCMTSLAKPADHRLIIRYVL
jgi:hypothetical protein